MAIGMAVAAVAALVASCGAPASSSSAGDVLDIDGGPGDALDAMGEVAAPDQSGDGSAMDGPWTDDADPEDIALDGGPDCEALCALASSCDDALAAACQAACSGGESTWCERECLLEATGCEEASSCVESAISDPSFHPGPYGMGIRDIAGGQELPTLKGTFSLKDLWTGTDSFVFLVTQTGFGYAENLWNSQVYYWLQQSPPNVHYVFMAYREPDGTDLAQAKVTEMKAHVDEGIDKIELVYGKAAGCHWRRRIHYVPVDAWSVEGWVGPMLQERPVYGFAIDRFQQIRNVGMLHLLSNAPQSQPLLSHLRFEVQHYDFEWERAATLEAEAEDVTVVTLVDGEHIGGGTWDVQFPAADVMAGFDTLELDLTSHCPDHVEGQGCPEWDTGAHLDVREFPFAPNEDADTPCQSQIAGVEAADEVPGSCTDDEAACTTDEDCAEGASCAGFSPAQEFVEAVDADTLPCSCSVPGADFRESTQTCRADGSGYDDCSCANSFEIGRWITTYAREGRWVHDVSPLLALLKKGGMQRLSYSAGNTYVTHLHVRLSNRGKGRTPTEITWLFGGGGYHQSYNEKYEPAVVSIPSDAAHVEIVAHITGHGFGVEKANCAEFCNHTHHFRLNGAEFSHDQPWVGMQYGCAFQVPEGTVPNQWGTWYLGRGGWCPGKEVTPFVADVTGAALLGEDNTITYESLFEGGIYQPEPKPNPSGGFGANIWMNSWLVVWK